MRIHLCVVVLTYLSVGGTSHSFAQRLPVQDCIAGMKLHDLGLLHPT